MIPVIIRNPAPETLIIDRKVTCREADTLRY